MTDTTTPALPPLLTDEQIVNAYHEHDGEPGEGFEHFKAGVRFHEQAVRKALAQQAQPAAWQVWWGIGEKRPHWPPYKTEAEALLAAAEIKSVTEVRPLYTTQPSQLELAQECKQWCGSDHCLGGCGNVTGLASLAQPAPAGDVLTDAELLDWLEQHPDAVVWSFGYRGPGRWTWTDGKSFKHEAATLRDAIRASLTQEGSTK